ncbi:transcriptional regulator [Escherichia coli]|uniref:Transcriptional regulator n=1 Tax=Escherichia coli TaxID=562 RepID=A0A376U9X3_ECOLX|nr:transcriptional regulator [Escherichia coli]
MSGGIARRSAGKRHHYRVGVHVGRILAIMVNLFNPQKILIGSPLSKAADILFPVISDSIRQQALPAYSQHISVESTQFSNQGTMAGAALVKTRCITVLC